MATCVVGHTTGDKPYIVPVPGNADRLIPEYVVRHGDRHLDVAGAVTRHPRRLSIDEAQWAIRFHEESLT